MKTICLILIAITMVFLVSQAQGEEWVSTGRNPSGNEHFYDRETLTKLPNGIIKVTRKMTYSAAGKSQSMACQLSKGTDDKHCEELSYVLSPQEINCVTREFRMMSVSAHSADGQVLDSDTFELEPSEGWLPMPPKSIGETIYNSVCLKE
jgi:hypothetical protein